MSEDVFNRIYEPIEREEGITTRNQYELDPLYTDYRYVWSYIECDPGRGRGIRRYLIPGYHVVNVIGYVQTKNPWTDEDDASGLIAKYSD